LPIVAARSGRTEQLAMNNSRSFYYFAFTFRFFSYGEGGPANCERDVLKT